MVVLRPGGCPRRRRPVRGRRALLGAVQPLRTPRDRVQLLGPHRGHLHEDALRAVHRRDLHHARRRAQLGRHPRPHAARRRGRHPRHRRAERARLQRVGARARRAVHEGERGRAVQRRHRRRPEGRRCHPARRRPHVRLLRARVGGAGAGGWLVRRLALPRPRARGERHQLGADRLDDHHGGRERPSRRHAERRRPRVRPPLCRVRRERGEPRERQRGAPAAAVRGQLGEPLGVGALEAHVPAAQLQPPLRQLHAEVVDQRTHAVYSSRARVGSGRPREAPPARDGRRGAAHADARGAHVRAPGRAAGIRRTHELHDEIRRRPRKGPRADAPPLV